IQHVIDNLEIEADNNSTIEVCNFHFWVAKHWGIKKAANEIPDEEILRVCQGIEQGKLSGPLYDAILIDEGQDLESSWLRLVLSTLKSETGSLLLVEDRAQEIYRRKSYSQELGLSFRGRSRILTINYRNTEQIVQFAWDMYEHFNPTKRSERSEGIVEIIPPQSTRRKGPAPFVKKTSSFHDEARSIASEIKRLHYIENIDYSQIAVFYRVKQMSIPYVKILINTFKKQGIPYYWLSENFESKRMFDRNESTVKISTVESAKGLEFNVVFVCNLDNFKPFSTAYCTAK
ncbi:MAG: nuclease, partial [Syntrophomonadaceae bacterium]|nr:nuclease [Syntrophomonadaceae bacterium]